MIFKILGSLSTTELIQNEFDNSYSRFNGPGGRAGKLDNVLSKSQQEGKIWCHLLEIIIASR